MDHGENVADGNGERSGIRAKLGGEGTKERPDEIGGLNTTLGVPENVALIREDRCAMSRAVASTHSDNHDSKERMKREERKKVEGLTQSNSNGRSSRFGKQKMVVRVVTHWRMDAVWSSV
jgi:hypothetical protein